MMKRLLCGLLALCLLTGLAACGSEAPQQAADVPAKTTQTTPTTSPTIKPLVNPDTDKVDILIIGNSHSIDAFWLLHYAFKDQFPDADLCFGILHFNGASIDEHLDIMRNNQSVIRYYKHENGKRSIKYDVTSKSVLLDREWDVIMMQPAKEDLADPNLNKDGRYALMEEVNKYVKTPHEFVWHVSWPSPNDEVFFSPEYVRQPPLGYKDKLKRLYGFNPVNQFKVMTDMTKQHVLSDPTYSNGLCSGTSVMYAYLVEGMPQIELWRDYTHLSDFSRLMVGYTLTAQLTGKPLKKISYDKIKIGWRHKQNKPQGVQKLTPELKAIMIRSVNYALEHPWDIPAQATNPTYVGKSTAATTKWAPTTTTSTTATSTAPTTTTVTGSTTTTTTGSSVTESTTDTTTTTDTTVSTTDTTATAPTESTADPVVTTPTESTTGTTAPTAPTGETEPTVTEQP